MIYWPGSDNSIFFIHDMTCKMTKISSDEQSRRKQIHKLSELNSVSEDKCRNGIKFVSCHRLIWWPSVCLHLVSIVFLSNTTHISKVQWNSANRSWFCQASITIRPNAKTKTKTNTMTTQTKTNNVVQKTVPIDCRSVKPPSNPAKCKGRQILVNNSSCQRSGNL